MANNRPANTIVLPTEMFESTMPQVGVTEKEVTQFMGAMSCVSTLWNAQLQETLNKRMLKSFLSAVVDDDREMVRKILDKSPELLLITPPANLVIESQLTWNKFYAESALNMAAKRKQIEMIKIMLPYLDQLEQTDEVAQAKAAALTAWNPQAKIIIPQEYATYAQSLINAFSTETFPNGKLSNETELALSSLFNLLLPKKAVKLDDHLDPELFLLALYKAYDDKFDTFRNDDQRSAFCIRTIGLAQSVLSPETAKIFCEGLYYVVEDNRKISDRAASLKLRGGESFYRSPRGSLSSLGFEYVVGGMSGAGGPRPWCRVPSSVFWKNYVEQKLRTYRAYAATPSANDRLCDLLM